MIKKLHISTGNSKMGQIPSVSLPPVKTCRAGAPCIKDCYACKLCRLYKNVKNSYEENYDLYKMDPDGYFNQLDAVLKLSTYFRLHVSGDFPNMDYFKRTVETVRKNKQCTVLAFTKQFELVNEYIDAGHRIPKNFKIIFSTWDGWNPVNPYNMPQSAVIFKHTDVPASWKICGGNCSECACRGVGCWELKRGETIAFYKH